MDGRMLELFDSRETDEVCEMCEFERCAPLDLELGIATKPVPWSSVGREVSTFR